MHFTIPYVTEVNDSDGKKVQMYKIYINGAHHCSARYNKFLSLHEEMKLHFDSQDLPYFPPKRLLKLNPVQTERRRDHLEYYIQRIASSSKFNNSVFHNFLKSCQKETKALSQEHVRLPIYFLNGQKFEIDISSTYNTKTVLDEFASFINLSRKATNLFGLFLVKFIKNGQNEEMAVIRQIQDFEYPYLSLKEMSLSCDCKIVIRKKVWDPEQETDIINSAASNSSTASVASLEVLYSQICGEVKYGWLSIPDSDPRSKRLKNLIETRSRKETIHLARTLPYYGYMMIHGICLANKPQSNTQVTIAIGCNQIVFRFPDKTDADDTDKLLFTLTRIKTWRISTTSNLDENHHHRRHNYTDDCDDDDEGEGDGDDGDSNNHDNGNGLKKNNEINEGLISFDYLSPETKRLECVEIRNKNADQIILMSMCLKSMAEEYVKSKSENNIQGSDSTSDYEYESLSGYTNFQKTIKQTNDEPCRLFIDPYRSMYYCADINDDDL